MVIVDHKNKDNSYLSTVSDYSEIWLGNCNSGYTTRGNFPFLSPVEYFIFIYSVKLDSSNTKLYLFLWVT